jgi:DNA polymerase-3 subunit beta
MTLIDAKELAAATGWATRAVPRTSTVPVLTAMRLECDGDRLTASGFDYETHAEASTAADGYLEPVLVNGATLGRAAASLSGQVTIEVEGTKLVLSTGRRSRFALARLPLDDYPTVPKMPPYVGESPDLVAAIEAVRESAADADGRAALQGTVLHVEGGYLHAVATDRYRLSAATTPWSGDPFTVMLPNSRSVAAALKDLNGHVAAHADGSWFGLAAGGRTVRTVLRDMHEHPGAIRMMSLIPGRSDDEVTVSAPREQLLAAIGDAEITVEAKHPVRLAVEDGVLFLEAAQDSGEGHHEVEDAEHHGDPAAATFNPAFLRSVVSRVPAAWVRLRWKTAEGSGKSPMHIYGYRPDTGEADFTVQHILMPQRDGA